jgi:hypothetical protein
LKVWRLAFYAQGIWDKREIERRYYEAKERERRERKNEEEEKKEREE